MSSETLMKQTLIDHNFRRWALKQSSIDDLGSIVRCVHAVQRACAFIAFPRTLCCPPQLHILETGAATEQQSNLGTSS